MEGAVRGRTLFGQSQRSIAWSQHARRGDVPKVENLRVGLNLADWGRFGSQSERCGVPRRGTLAAEKAP